jgi:hypothetical protein
MLLFYFDVCVRERERETFKYYYSYTMIISLGELCCGCDVLSSIKIK